MKLFYKAVVLVTVQICSSALTTRGEQVLAPCNSQIFCYSDFLHTMQTAHLYADSKTFVDKPLKVSQAEILEAFQKLPRNASSADLKGFIDVYMAQEGHELEAWIPTDYNEKPAILSKIKDGKLREMAVDLNKKWRQLGRKIKKDVGTNQERYSLIYVKNPFIIPGGRFREFYYWDSYWIIEGLLACGMDKTVRGMLENFLDLVQRYGFVPNGGRVYYLNRSQPPLLIPMVARYLEHTNDTDFLQANLAALEKEYSFWLVNRSIEVSKDKETYTANRYMVLNNQPRPESYVEDLTLANNSSRDADELYADLASAAESGWDFSSRWFGYGRTGLRYTHTSKVIPVDLNSFLCWNAHLLSEFSQKLGKSEKSEYYLQDYKRRVKMIDDLMWNESYGAWFDYDISKSSQSTQFYASVVSPVFTRCLISDSNKARRREEKLAQYIQKTISNFKEFNAGVPTSLKETGQQWDLPNAWPPLQHMWVMSLRSSGNKQLRELGHTLAKKWLKAVWKRWSDRHDMYEKYNAYNGDAGRGGEYDVQTGFGWTNGVILELLRLYPDVEITESNSAVSTSFSAMCLFVSLFI